MLKQSMVAGALSLATLSLASAEDVLSPLFDADSYYIGAQVGQFFHTEADVSDSPISNADLDDGTSLSLTLGQRTGMFRSELELFYGTQDIESVEVSGSSFPVSGEIDSLGAMANVYYAPKIGNWEPYLGGGVGVTHYSVDLNDIKVNDDVLTYQGKIGLAYHIDHAWAIDANYVYQDGSSIDVGDAEIDQAKQVARIGVRYTF